MKKLNIVSLSFILIASAQAHSAIEVKTPSQPPVITGEFQVAQENQAQYQNMAKDTDQIKVESDFLGLKQLKEDMAFSQIKKRFTEGYKKLAADSNHLQRFPNEKEYSNQK